MNWGTKIAVGMSIFMVFIVVMVFTMFNSKTDALVDSDYYEKSINYDKVYDKKEQVKLDSAAPVIAVNAENIILVFKAPSQGTIRLMRTSDKKLDKAISFETNSANQVSIPATSLQKGPWRLIADWISQEKSYLYEQEITVR